MQDYELKISQFVDDELPADEQAELFQFLSKNEEGREALAGYIKMKEEAKTIYTDMEVELGDSNLSNTIIMKPEQEDKKYKRFFYLSAAASIVFAFLFLFNAFKPNPMLKEYESLQTKMIKLQENYNAGLSERAELIKANDLLSEETEKLKLSEEVEKTKTEKRNSVNELPKKNVKQKKTNFNNHNNYLADLQTFTITKDDFLGKQIIGN